MKRPRDPSAAGGDGWDGTGYDIAADPQHAWGREVLDRTTLRSGASVLDAGCGSGRVTEELLRRYPDARVVAIDASASMAEAAQVRLARFGARVRVECARLPDGLPQEPTFDAIISTGTLHWIPDHGQLFAAFHRALRVPGLLVAQAGGEGSLASVRAALNALGVATEHLNRYAGVQETEQLLADSGFGDVRCWTEARRIAFATSEDLADFLLAAAIGPYLEGAATAERLTIAREVSRALEEPAVQFVRLNIQAWRR